jgi:hypothetical protein
LGSTWIGANKAAQWLHIGPYLVSATWKVLRHIGWRSPQIDDSPGCTSRRTVGIPPASVIVFPFVREALVAQQVESAAGQDIGEADQYAKARIGGVAFDPLEGG